MPADEIGVPAEEDTAGALVRSHPRLQDVLGPEPLNGLADVWEKNKTIRRHALKEMSLLGWPSQEQTGVISQDALASNCDVILEAIEVWCPQVSVPKAMPVEDLKVEADLLSPLFGTAQLPICFLLCCFFVFLLSLPTCQVRKFRANLRLSLKPSLIHSEAHAVKGLLSFMHRRNVIVKRRDPIIKMMFERLGKYWPPRSKSRPDLDTPQEDASQVVEASPLPDTQVADDALVRAEDVEEPEPSEDSQIAPSTPEQFVKPEEDEYLAWTLGGKLKATLTPGTPWATYGLLSPAKDGEKDVGQAEDVEIEAKIAALELLGLMMFEGLCVQPTCH